MTENNGRLTVQTIQEMKNSEKSGLTYELIAQIKEVFRTKEGLNIFTINDGNQDFKLVKFISGSAAFPNFNKNSVALFVFKRKHHDGKLQGDLIDISSVSSQKESDFLLELTKRKLNAFKPVNSALLFDTPAFNLMKDSMHHVASTIRQAVIEHRPIVISHHNDVDGFTAGLLLEDAIKPFILKHYPLVRYMNNYLTRYPSRTPFYDVIDATKDIAVFLQNMDRNDTIPPLILVVDNGSTHQDILSMQKAKLFGADIVVIDHHYPGVLSENGKSLVCAETKGHVNPHLKGINQNISASLLCYEISNMINEFVKPNAHTALLGAVADRCEGEEVDILLNKLNSTREQYQEYSLTADFEIFQTKMNLSTSALFNFLRGDKVDELVALYKPLLTKEREEIKLTVTHYQKEEKIGKFNVHFLDGEKNSIRGDYYQLGRLAAILHSTCEDVNNTVTCVFSNTFIVFRVKQEETIFDVNKLVPFLQKKLPHARISGGGHAVAGSIKAIPIAMPEVMSVIKEYILSL